MARQLIYGNDIVSFTPSTGVIVVNGYIPLQKLLLINNATINTTLYNFSDPNTTAVCTFEPSTNRTAIDLSINTASMSSTDKLQIYYEKEELEIKPSRTYRDPVSKFRVSEPQTLIDTDFEYGIQPTKWETVKLVNNLPTSYVAQTAEEALQISNITVPKNSDIVTVDTITNHNLIAGSIIEVVGLKDSQFEGTFLVKTVPDANTFTYKIPFKSPQRKNLYTIYSLIYPGSFYTGSAVEVADVSTDKSIGNSTLTVTTGYFHGFNNSTKLYLKQSRATKQFAFVSPADVVATATTTFVGTFSGQGGVLNEYFYNQKFITDDWIGNHEISIAPGNINLTNGVITYTLSSQVGVAAVTPLKTGDLVTFYTPEGNNPPLLGAASSYFRPFYVFNATVTGGVVQFQIAEKFGSTTPYVFSSAGTNLFGNHRIIKGSKILNITAADVVTCDTAHGFSNGDNVVAISTFTTGISNIQRSRHNGQRLRTTGDDYFLYTASNISLGAGVTTLTLSNNPNSGTGRLNFNASNSPLVGLFKIRNIDLSNSLYLPPTAGFSTTGMTDGQLVTYTISGASPSFIGGLSPNTKYLLKTVNNSFPNWFKIYPSTNVNLDANINLFIRSGFEGNTYNSTTHTFTSTVNRPDRHTISINNPPRGEIGNNADVVYTSNVTEIGGLNLNATYQVKTEDPLINSTQLRLAERGGTARIFDCSYSANASTATIRLVANNNSQILTGIGITRVGSNQSQIIQVTGINGTISENIFFNGLHRLVSVAATANSVVALTVEVDSTKNTASSFSIPSTATAKLQSTKVCGIVSFSNIGGAGSHFLAQNVDGIADDIYISANTQDKSFDFATSLTIPSVIKNTLASNVTTGSNSYIKVEDHYFADGTAVVYTTTGAAIGGLTPSTTYYVRVRDRNFISLSQTSEGAINRETGTLIQFSSQGTGTHIFTTDSVKGFLPGSGSIGFTTTSNLITGTEKCKFLSDFTNGDLFRIYKLTNTGTGPGTYFESKVTSVKSDRTIKLESNPSFNDSAANYFVPTTIYAISDGKTVHRPFDGGVNITTGLIPNSQIIRQTRKYFRYQSGKGIQVSMAVNFNPTFDIDNITKVGAANTTVFNINCKFPHQLSPDVIGSEQKIKISGVIGSASTVFNRTEPFSVVSFSAFNSDFNFRIDTGVPVENISDIGGFAQYSVTNWADCSIKAGLFDDQNGFFFEYDGRELYAVRRSSTQQLSGLVEVERASHRIVGTDSLFGRQLEKNDRIVIRGQTYKVIKIIDDTTMDVQPAYRGNTTSEIVISKVIDTKIPQSQWNLDKMDGTGVSGYKLDINRIQMIYMDYSWYGAGTIRFGFKDTIGEVRYCHEFYHNNVFTESYMRSGNVPARYEVETFDNPLFSPSLFHWGASVIMDGRFDDDKAYLFTAESKTLPFTNGGYANSAGTRPDGTVTNGSNVVTGINATEASVLTVGEVITDSGSAATFPTGTTITSIQIDQSSENNKFGNVYSLTTSNNATTSGPKTLNIFSGTSTSLKSFIPLVSIRLSPSVDNATTGNLGFRDIITRMQLTLKSAGVLTTHDCEVRLILNAKLSNDNFVSVGSPSLSQIYKHEVNDTYSSGTTVFAFRAQGGSVTNTTTGRRSLNVTDVALDELALLGNSILGGDGVYPDGPDVLTIAVKPVDTSQITGSSPFIVTARMSWTEAQA